MEEASGAAALGSRARGRGGEQRNIYFKINRNDPLF